MKSNLRADSHAKTNGNGIHQVLDGKDQGKRCHGIFTDLRNKEAVYYIIQRVYQHGDHHGESHGHDQRKYWLFFHKSIVHLYSSCWFIKKTFMAKK